MRSQVNRSRRTPLALMCWTATLVALAIIGAFSLWRVMRPEPRWEGVECWLESGVVLKVNSSDVCMYLAESARREYWHGWRDSAKAITPVAEPPHDSVKERIEAGDSAGEQAP